VFDDGVAFAKERQHVTAEEESLGKRAENWKGSCDEEKILHLSGAGGKGAEEVVGLHRAKDALDHGDLEVGGRLHGGDLAGEILPNTKVTGAPGDLLRELDETCGDAAYGQRLFGGVDVPDQMNFDASGEVEASFDGSLDDSDFLYSDHGISEILAREAGAFLLAWMLAFFLRLGRRREPLIFAGLRCGELRRLSRY
jgi:hypothetical protein